MQQQIPVCIHGSVLPRPDVDVCMDGATHLFATMGGEIRLKARNEEAHAALEKHKNLEVVVQICGYWTKGAQCDHLSVYMVSGVESSDKEPDYCVFALTGSDPKRQCQILPCDAIVLGIYSRAFGPGTKEECESFLADNCQ